MAAGSDTWDALVVLCGPSVSPSEARDLVDQAVDAETGLAVVVCGDPGGTRHRLTLDGTGWGSPSRSVGHVGVAATGRMVGLEGLGGLVATAADLSSVPASAPPYASMGAASVVPPERTEGGYGAAKTATNSRSHRYGNHLAVRGSIPGH